MFKWMAIGDRVTRGDAGGFGGADHDFKVYGGDDRAEAFADSINTDIGEVKRAAKRLADALELVLSNHLDGASSSTINNAEEALTAWHEFIKGEDDAH